MNRILFEKEEIGAGGTVRLEPGDFRAVHIREVLHAEPGCPVKTGVVDGLAGASVLAADGPDGMVLETRHDACAPLPWIDVVLAIPRPRALKRIMPQLASMGARRIILAGAEKTEKAYWGAHILGASEMRKLLVEGLMQAGTTALPEVREERNLKSYAGRGAMERDFAAQPSRFTAHPGEKSGALRVERGTVPVVAIGPEGGWTEGEREMLERSGFAALSLGPRTLRTETAAVALVAVIQRAVEAR